jgi:hypothetical protein
MTPLAIYQDALNVVSEAVLANDFPRYVAMIDFPYLIQTATANLVAASPADLQPTFETLSKGLKARGVTHYERVGRAADYVARDRIEGWHYTHILANGERVAYPHMSHHVLVRRGQLWLFSEAQYDIIKADRWPLSDADMFAHTKSLQPKVRP